MLQSVASPSRACLPEVPEGCAASPLKSVDQAGACGEHTSFPFSRVLGACVCGEHTNVPISRVFQACACGEYANVLVSRVFKHVLVVECTSLLNLRVFQACDLLYLHKPSPSQEFKECACGQCTCLPVSRCCRLALVVTPTCRISDSTPSMHLGKSRKTSCRENVSGGEIACAPLVSPEMPSGSQKRATLCSSSLV